MFTIIGIEEINYISKKTNRQVTGRRIHYTSDITKDGQGLRAENDYVSDEIGANLYVGDQIEIYYNRYGAISQIKVV